jgi:acyl-CoA synthetase (AMP-forming)/AMP-acid ligase II
MLGLMQNQPLLISSLIDFAERHHGDGEIVSRRVEGDVHRYAWRDVAARSRRVANALDALKLGFSDRVATLAWNGYRHLELYFGVSGSGRVLHTLNPRLHPEQIVCQPCRRPSAVLRPELPAHHPGGARQMHHGEALDRLV